MSVDSSDAPGGPGDECCAFDDELLMIFSPDLSCTYWLATLLTTAHKTRERVLYSRQASAFANLLHAQLIELDSNCGHRVHGCEMQRIGRLKMCSARKQRIPDGLRVGSR